MTIEKSIQLLLVVEEGVFVVEELKISKASVKNGELLTSINGNQYSYKPVGMDIDRLHSKFNKMLGFSAGKALAWLKKNSELSSGSTRKGKA